MTILYSDGAMNKSTKDCAWGSVVDSDGKDMISCFTDLVSDFETVDEILPRGIGKRTLLKVKFADVASQQINGAEISALLVALRIAKKEIKITKIKCDSQVAISWATKGPLLNTKKKMDPKKIKLVDEAIRLRKEFLLRGGTIDKISGDDNLADCGFH